MWLSFQQLSSTPTIKNSIYAKREHKTFARLHSTMTMKNVYAWYFLPTLNSCNQLTIPYFTTILAFFEYSSNKVLYPLFTTILTCLLRQFAITIVVVFQTPPHGSSSSWKSSLTNLVALLTINDLSPQIHTLPHNSRALSLQWRR